MLCSINATSHGIVQHWNSMRKSRQLTRICKACEIEICCRHWDACPDSCVDSFLGSILYRTRLCKHQC